MTNIKPITPFCCDMSEATEDEIRELHKMCLDVGAYEHESCDWWIDHRYDYPYMGVDEDNDTMSDDCLFNNRITLDQVPEHLVNEEQNYCSRQPDRTSQESVESPLTGFNTKLDESHTEGVKRPVWTPTCFKEGIQYQVGMQVGIESANVKGNYILVNAIGDEFVLLSVDGKEWCVRKDAVLPVITSQRDKVIACLEQMLSGYGRATVGADDIYNEVLKLGVFKEDGEYAEL